MWSTYLKEFRKSEESSFLNANCKFSDKGNLGIVPTSVSFLEKIKPVRNKEMVISNLTEV